MKRRSFLKHTAHSMAIPGLLGSITHQSMGASLEHFLRLANNTDRTLVLIYLEGGNDGLNTIIPMASMEGMSRVRPHVILPENRLLQIPEQGFAFHPSLQGLHSLYREDRLQVIHSVGYPEPNFSHFRSTDIWMSASASNELVSTGWTGRYLEALHPEFPNNYPNENFPHPLALEMGHGASMLFQGEKIGLGMVINDPDNFYQLINQTQGEAPEGVIGDKIKFIRLVAQQSQQYGQIIREAADKIKQQKAYPQTRLAQQLKIVSRLIAGGMRTPLYLVRLGGFDTHDNQVDPGDHTQGVHANLLQVLDEAILAFMQDQEHLGTADRVMGMTFSEFGRRIVSNASVGTDHGTAAPLFVFGNFSKGGVLGRPPEIIGTEQYRDNLPIQHDFRQVYHSVLGQWLGAGEAEISAATLGRQFDDVPVVKGVVTSAAPTVSLAPMIYPNPFRDTATVQLRTPGSVTILLYDLMGRKVGLLFEGVVKNEGLIQPIDTSGIPAGRYIIKIDSSQGQFSKHVVKM